MSDLKLSSLRGKIHVKHGFPFKGEYFQSSGPYIILTPGNFHEEGGFKRNPGKDKCYAEPFPKEYLLKRGDVVVAMTEQTDGLLGSMAIIPEDGRFLHNQRLGLVTSLSSEVDVRFLYHLFKTKMVRDQIKRSASGSKVKHTSPEKIYDIRVYLPLPQKQLAIAKILTILDAKIELNNRINAELEAMAKLLYDYWFVQFDFPMTAAQAVALGKPQLAGKPYRSSGGKMSYNEVLKREIPQGWEAKTLSHLVPVTKESVDPEETPDKVFKLFSIPVFDATGTYSLEKGVNVGSNKFIVTGNDILVSKLNPWFSRVIYTPADIEAVCSTEFVVWKTIASWMKAFLFIVARSPQFVTFCTQSATGTSNSHKRVNPEVMMSHSIPWEPGQAQSFGETVNPILLARQLNEIQNKELAQLRDWLLPMLMNGQVTVN